MHQGPFVPQAVAPTNFNRFAEHLLTQDLPWEELIPQPFQDVNAVFCEFLLAYIDCPPITTEGKVYTLRMTSTEVTDGLTSYTLDAQDNADARINLGMIRISNAANGCSKMVATLLPEDTPFIRGG